MAGMEFSAENFDAIITKAEKVFFTADLELPLATHHLPPAEPPQVWPLISLFSVSFL